MLKNNLNHIFPLANNPTRMVTHIQYGEPSILLAFDNHFDYYYEYKLFNDTNV